MFINISNHPSDKWSAKQREAALAISRKIVKRNGEGKACIIDIPFPNIPPEATTKRIQQMADDFTEKIADEYEGDDVAIHLMGELTFTYNLVCALDVHDFTCYAATSDRKSVENADGSKIVQFDFVQFRAY